MQNININEAPLLGLDLNVVPNQQEMIVDPLFPSVVEVAPELAVEQVNEEEEDAEMEEEAIVENNNVQG